MKLKTFDKVNTSMATEYMVLSPEGKLIEFFTVDYSATPSSGIDDNILKKLDYIKRGAEVQTVRAMFHCTMLHVTLISSSWPANLTPSTNRVTSSD